jgi:hypothetical protein
MAGNRAWHADCDYSGMYCRMRFPIVLSLLLGAACQHADQEASVGPSTAKVTYSADGMPEGLPRFRKWSPKHFQGAQPEGEIAFGTSRHSASPQ